MVTEKDIFTFDALEKNPEKTAIFIEAWFSALGGKAGFHSGIQRRKAFELLKHPASIAFLAQHQPLVAEAYLDAVDQQKGQTSIQEPIITLLAVGAFLAKNGLFKKMQLDELVALWHKVDNFVIHEPLDFISKQLALILKEKQPLLRKGGLPRFSSNNPESPTAP